MAKFKNRVTILVSNKQLASLNRRQRRGKSYGVTIRAYLDRLVAKDDGKPPPKKGVESDAEDYLKDKRSKRSRS